MCQLQMVCACCVAGLACCVPTSPRQLALPSPLPGARKRAWQAVSRRHDGATVLESSDYQQRTRMGLRIGLQHRPGSDSAQLWPRGAGPCFTDLGVDAAADQLHTAMVASAR